MSGAPSILIVAGELSGDVHAARILRSLNRRIPGLKAWGFGGDNLAAEGMEVREHVRGLSVMGIYEVLKHYGYFRRVFHRLLEETRQRRPDLILLVDYPGFNLRFAKAVRDLEIPVAQYVCPQVWAWKKNRIPRMAEVLDELVCIFPFEPAVFEGTDLKATYRGHPLVEETMSVEALPGWKPGAKKLAVVPGSREQEIDRLFLPMMRTAHRLGSEIGDLHIRVSAADRRREHQLRALLRTLPELGTPDIVVGNMRGLVKGADAALVTSGTATLETSLVGTPMLVVYKTSPLTYAIGKRVVKVPHIGMVNLVAGREVCPEFIQYAAEPEAMAAALKPLLSDTPERRRMLEGLAEVRDKLVPDDGGDRVAAVLEPYLLKTTA